MPWLSGRLPVDWCLLLLRVLRHSGLLRIRLHWVLLLLSVLLLLLLSRILVAILLHWLFGTNPTGAIGRTGVLVGAGDRGMTTCLAMAVKVDAGYDEGDEEEDAGQGVLVFRSATGMFDEAQSILRDSQFKSAEASSCTQDTTVS